MDEHIQRPILLFIDWDSTLTTTSTLPLIASVGEDGAVTDRDWAGVSFPSLTAAYTADLALHTSTYSPSPSHRITLAQESRYLASLRPIELASLSRIESSRLFSGVTPRLISSTAVDAVARNLVSLRKGWSILLTTKRATGEFGIEGCTHVISVSWSDEFIRGVLEASCEKEGELDAEHVRSSIANDVFVHANGIDGGRGRVVPGRLARLAPKGQGKEEGQEQGEGRLILTAGDKLDVVKEVIAGDMRFGIRSNEDDRKNENSPANHPPPPPIPLTIFIGDSPTDLLCLLHADIGICIRDAPTLGGAPTSGWGGMGGAGGAGVGLTSEGGGEGAGEGGEKRGGLTSEQAALAETLARLGVEVRPMYTLLASMDEGWERRKVVWWARDLMEVMLSGVLDPSWLF